MFVYEAEIQTAAVIQVEPRPDPEVRVVSERWASTPDLRFRTYGDLFGNICRRTLLPAGPTELVYQAVVDVSSALDSTDPSAAEVPPDLLPDDTLLFTLPSRFCLPDVLADVAWSTFGGIAPGYGRVQAISDYVHQHLVFDYQASSPTFTALDVFERKTGVCRDFAHLFISLCRSLNMPARYVFGYLPDIDVEPTGAPMDFHAWAEVFIGNRWWPFDPRNNERRIGRVVIGRGRDAADVAMVTTFGGPRLLAMTVVAAPIPSGADPQTV